MRMITFSVKGRPLNGRLKSRAAFWMFPNRYSLSRRRERRASIRPPGGSGPGPGRAHPPTQVAGEMRFCLPEPWPASPDGDRGWHACVWFRATHTGADRRFQAGLARNLAPVRTLSEDDPIAIRSRTHPSENTAVRYLYRRAIRRVPVLYFAL